MTVSFGTVDLRDVVAAAYRGQLHRAGHDLPGWGEWRSRASDGGPSWEMPAGTQPAGTQPAGTQPAEPHCGAPSDPAGDTSGIAAGSETRLGTADWAGHVMTEPGPGLAGWLSRAEPRELDDAALMTSITGWRKLTSWAQARELTAVAELARRRGARAGEDLLAGHAGAACADETARPPGAEDERELRRADAVRELAAEFAPNEVALALTLTRIGAEYWMELAVSLADRLPRTLAALGAGTIDLNRARLIDHHTSTLSVDLARTVEGKVLPKAGRQTSGQLRATLQRAVITADPAAAERRRQETERNARVEISGDEDSTAALGGRFLPAAQASAAWARICALAKAMECAGAAGGADLLRAQVFTGLLLGTLPFIPPAGGDPGSPPPPTGPDSPAGSRSAGTGSAGTGSAGTGSAGTGPAGSGPAGSGSSGGSSSAGSPTSGGSSAASPTAGGSAGGGGCPGDWAGGDPCDNDGSAGADHTAPGGTGLRSPGPLDGAPQDGATRGTEPSAGFWPLGGSPPPWPPIPQPGHITTPGCALPWPAPGPPLGPGANRAGPAGARDPAPDSAAAEGVVRRPGRDGKALLTVSWCTLAGLSTQPGTLSRIGPVTAEVARNIAVAALVGPDCTWRVIVTDHCGRALGVATVPRRFHTRPDRQPSATAVAVGEPSGLLAGVTLVIPLALADTASSAAVGTAGATGTAAAAGAADAVGTEGAIGTAGAAGWACQPQLRPVLAAALRAAAQAAGRFRATQPGDGTCSHPDEVPGYRIPESMRTLIEARDQTCRFPCCRQPAWRCDHDHTIPYHRGGRTCPCNLGAACRHHHRLKQLSTWGLTQTHPGQLTWHTPARLTYTITPATHLS